MTFLIIIYAVLNINGSALSYNPTLDDVAYLRMQYGTTAYHVKKKPWQYECLVGLPYGFKHLINREVVFEDVDGNVYEPWLVVDVESDHHSTGRKAMSSRDLLADINCKEYVHLKGKLWIEWKTVVRERRTMATRLNPALMS